MWIRIKVPTVTRAAVSNVLGMLGLAGIVAATGGLTGNPWIALLVASLMLVGISYASYTHAATPAAAADDRPKMAAAVATAPPARAA